MEIEISVPTRLMLPRAGTAGGAAREEHRAGLERIREAVRSSEHRSRFQDWLESRTRLGLLVQFHLERDRVANADIEALLPVVVHALVEGACGSRDDSGSVPRATEALFWQIVVSKREAPRDRIVVRVTPL